MFWHGERRKGLHPRPCGEEKLPDAISHSEAQNTHHWWNIRMIINEISNKSKQTSSYRKEQFRYASVAWKEVTTTVFSLSYKKMRLFKAKNSLFPTTETWDININFKLMRSYKIFVLFYLANYSMFIFFNLKLKKYTQKSILRSRWST